MSQQFDDPVKSDQHAITRYTGRPNEPLKEGEPSLWKRFLAKFVPWTKEAKEFGKRGKEMAEAYAQAEVANKVGEAQAKAADAARMAAEADERKAATVKDVNAELERIFSSSAPEALKGVQLEMLASRFPEVKKSLERLQACAESLKIQHGSQFSFKEIEGRTRNQEKANISSSKIYDALNAARTAEKVRIRTKSGKMVAGNFIFSPLKGSVRIIDIDAETSEDFLVSDIEDLKFID